MVAISFLFGENGLITRAQQAKLQQEIETARETLTMVLGDAFVEKKINPDYDQNGFLDEFIKAKEQNVYLAESAIGLDGHVFGLDRSVPELGEYQGELTGPRIQDINILEETTSSATIEVVTENAEGATYTYSYKINGTEEWIEVEIEDENSNTCTIEGLTQGEIYNIKVVVTTDTGTAEKETNVYLGEIPEGAIQFTPVEWVGDGTATTTIDTSVEGYTLQYQVVVGDAEPVNTAWKPATPGQTIGNLHHNETVYGRLFDGTNESKVYATVKVTDEELPEVSVSTSNITTNGATLTVTASDRQSGLADTNTYQYFVDEETTARETSTNNSYNYTGLTQGTDHILKVIVTDRAGNTKEEIATVTTTSLPGGQDAVEQGVITFTTPTWSGGKASVTISTNTTNKMQYQVGATIVEENWQPVPEGGIIGNLNHNDTVFARLYDGTNYGNEASTTVKDEKQPDIINIATEETDITLKVTVTARDNESGIASYTYVIEGQDSVTTTGASYTFEGLTPQTEYSIQVTVTDRAGHIMTKSTNVTTTEFIPKQTPTPESGGKVMSNMRDGIIEIKWLSGTTNNVTDTPNAPVIAKGEDLPEGTTMEQVVFNEESQEWITGTEYSYVAGTGSSDNTSSKWANARVTIDGIDSYFVWIPRYAYRIIYFDTSESKIAYQEGTLTEEDAIANGQIIGYSDSRGIVDAQGRKIESVTSTSNSPKIMVSEDYFMTHPAFMNGTKTGFENGEWNKELAGIWVGKSEVSSPNATDTSYGSKIGYKVQLGVFTKNSLNYGQMYTRGKEYSIELNSHMLKNSEWGAIVYLTESKYGRNGVEVEYNLTKHAGGGPGNAYIENTKQSSTGNVYGIYDLSGNLMERVAAYYRYGDFHQLNINGFPLTSEQESDQYSTAYEVASEHRYDSTGSSKGYRYGDATYETRGWHSDDKEYSMCEDLAFIHRGDWYAETNTESIGIFAYYPGKSVRKLWNWYEGYLMYIKV